MPGADSERHTKAPMAKARRGAKVSYQASPHRVSAVDERCNRKRGDGAPRHAVPVAERVSRGCDAVPPNCFARADPLPSPAMHLEPVAWLVSAVAVLFVGITKSGLGGALGGLAVP